MNQRLEGGVKLNDLNMNQEVPGIVSDYQKKVVENLGPDSCNDIPKEAMEVNPEAEHMVARGRLNRATGQEIPLTDKARTAANKQSCPTPEYLKGYSRIDWDADLTKRQGG